MIAFFRFARLPFFVPVLLLVLLQPALAQLGKTKAEVTGMLGKPWKQSPAGPGYDTLIGYRHDGLVIAAFYQGKKCVALAYAPMGENKQPVREPLSKDQKMQILAQNADGSSWKYLEPPLPDGTMWERPDGAKATYDKRQFQMMLALPAFRERIQKERAAKEKP